MSDKDISAEPPPGLDCGHVVRRLWDYLDGRVAEEEREQIVAHLAWCNACSSHYHFEQSFLNAVGRARRSDENFDALRSQIIANLRANHLGNDR